MGRNGVVAPAPGDCHVAIAPRNDGARRRAKAPNPFLCVIASPSPPVILSAAKNLAVLRTGSAKQSQGGSPKVS